MVETGREGICRWICIAAHPWKLQQKARCWEFIGMALYHRSGWLHCCGSLAIMLCSFGFITEYFALGLKVTPCNHFIRLWLSQKMECRNHKKISEVKRKMLQNVGKCCKVRAKTAEKRPQKRHFALSDTGQNPLCESFRQVGVCIGFRRFRNISLFTCNFCFFIDWSQSI